MAGRKNFDTLRAKMDPARRARNNAGAAREVALARMEMALGEIRKGMEFNQEELADRMGVTQPALSRIEAQRDMYLSTINRFIEALGGKLELLAHLPGMDVSIKLEPRDELRGTGR